MNVGNFKYRLYLKLPTFNVEIRLKLTSYVKEFFTNRAESAPINYKMQFKRRVFLPKLVPALNCVCPVPMER